jgi:hypothetical protein
MTARCPELPRGLGGLSFSTVIAIPSLNAWCVIAVRELADIAALQVIESYFDLVIRLRPPPGVVMFAHCSFNPLNVRSERRQIVSPKGRGGKALIIAAIVAYEGNIARPRIKAEFALRFSALRHLSLPLQADRNRLARTNDTVSPREPQGGFITLSTAEASLA